MLWINCDDDLPEPNQRVLVCADKFEAMFRKDRKIVSHNILFISYYYEYCPLSFQWECKDYFKPIYWMPLPEAPLRNKKEGK